MGPRKREGGVTSSPPSGSVGRCLDGAPEPSPGALCSFPNCQGECKSAGSAVRPVAHPEPPAARFVLDNPFDARELCATCGSQLEDGVYCLWCADRPADPSEAYERHLKLIEAGAYHHRGGSEPAQPRSFAGFLTSGRLA